MREREIVGQSKINIGWCSISKVGRCHRTNNVNSLIKGVIKTDGSNWIHISKVPVGMVCIEISRENDTIVKFKKVIEITFNHRRNIIDTFLKINGGDGEREVRINKDFNICGFQTVKHSFPMME